jgi:hypothetical protein
MSDPGSAAINAARRAMGLDRVEREEAVWVARDDGPDPYWLVALRAGDRQVIVVVSDGGDVLQWVDTAPGPLLPVDEAAALAASGFDDAEAGLMWRPSRASLSPLLPLWEVRRGDRRRWVDQGGRVWDELPAAGRG